MPDRTDQIVDDAQTAIRIHDGVMALKAEVERLRKASMRIAPDMVVRNIVNGKHYKVRSVSKTKAVCWPCSETGKRHKHMGGAAIEMQQSRLEPVKR